mgnify:CR=1 FL=1
MKMSTTTKDLLLERKEAGDAHPPLFRQQQEKMKEKMAKIITTTTTAAVMPIGRVGIREEEEAVGAGPEVLVAKVRGVKRPRLPTTSTVLLKSKAKKPMKTLNPSTNRNPISVDFDLLLVLFISFLSPHYR